MVVLSANAFDKHLDNDVGVRPEEFIVKPFKLAELLDCLGRRLELEWLTADTPAAPAHAAEAPPLVPPGEAELAALDQLIDLGYLRGILDKLAAIAAADARHAEFARVLAELARQFDFDAMKELLRQTRATPTP